MLLVGHLGKEKTVRRVLQRYHCVLVSVVKLVVLVNKQGKQALLITLLIVDVSFKHIAVDIVGQLLHSRAIRE